MRHILPATLLLSFLAAAFPLRAQHNEAQELAARLAIEIARTQKKKVAVAYFPGPGEGVTEFGRVVSLELAASLGWAGRGLEVSHTESLDAALRERGISAKAQFERGVILRLAASARTEIIVMGTIEPAAATVLVTARAFDAEANLVGEATVNVAKTAAIEELLARQPLRLERRGLVPPATGCGRYGSNVLTPGRDGVSNPVCKSCPTAGFTEDARRAKTSGVVIFAFVVTAEGKADQISLVKRLGYGLDEATVEKVKTWRFEPATRGGQPVATCLTAEMNFRIM